MWTVQRLAVLMTAVVLLGACGGGEATVDEAAIPDLTATDFSFEPAELTGTVGEETAFEVANDGQAEHNVTIEELGVDEDIEAGAHVFVTVTPEEAGEFAFFCKFHPEQMTGTLSVE